MRKILLVLMSICMLAFVVGLSLIHIYYNVYVPFESVVGFTPDWKELQAVNTHGGIYVVPLDLQLAPYKDKMRLQAAIKHYRDTHEI